MGTGRCDPYAGDPRELRRAAVVLRAMKAAWLFILGAACGAQPGRAGVAVESGSRGTRETPRSSFIPARGPFASISPPPAGEPPLTWLAPETDVLLVGQTPVVHVYAETGGGRFRKTGDFQLRGLGAASVAPKCDHSREPTASRGFATLDFACQYPRDPGLFTITFDPSRHGLNGTPVEAPIRVLKTVPKTPPAPTDWGVVPLAAGITKYCDSPNDWYEAHLDSGKLALDETPMRNAVPIPAPLANRMSAHHAEVVKFVFEEIDGYLVMFDHGEFGGGIEWYEKSGGQPRSITIGATRVRGELVPQNVNRARAIDGVLYVLQGVSHMGFSAGQLSALWREHDHFTSRVIARYRSEPVDWILQTDGTWLILTWEAIWKTSRNGEVDLVARLPDVLDYPLSLSGAPDGTLYVGGRGAVLRLTPLWNEAPVS
jgi:hypothetical protein